MGETKRILLTGATGFMANHLAPRLLKDGDFLLGLDTRLPLWSSPFPVLSADITNLNDLLRVPAPDFDYLIHLAAVAAPDLAKRDPAKAYDINVRGTYNVLSFALNMGIKRVLFLSTAHVYGISPRYMPTDEKHPLALHDTYTVTKILGENMCKMFYDNYHLPYVTLRLFNSYGPKQSFDYFLPAMIKKAREGKIDLKGAKTTKDFIYIDDVIDAIILALKSEYVGELNVGSGVQTPLGTIASMVANHYKVPYTEAETQPSPTFMQADIKRINHILGWEPTTTLETGMEKTLAYYDSVGVEEMNQSVSDTSIYGNTGSRS